jgi:N-carbamoylputrescine amidase
MSDRRLRVAVCEAPVDMLPGSERWRDLAQKAREARAGIILLNEMPFGPWLAHGEMADATLVRHSCRIHKLGEKHLQALGAPVVFGTRPIKRAGRLVNEAFIWNKTAGLTGVHTKQYFPNEEGFYEARWFEAGARHFRVVRAGALSVGFLICTEVMFTERARRYGRLGAQVIAVPRACGSGSLARWLVALRMAAIVSGCYVLSSNRSGTDANGQQFGGCGWIIDPSGEMVAQSSPASPVISYDIDTEFVAAAQRAYPCYVPELPR